MDHDDETPEDRAQREEDAADLALQIWQEDRDRPDPDPDDYYDEPDPEREAYDDAVDAQGPTDNVAPF